MTGRITLVLALGVVPGTGASAQQPIRFRIAVAGGVVSGWEEFTLIAMGSGGFQLTGRAEMTRGSERFELVQNTLLGVDRGPGRYGLTLTARGTTQSIESWREGDTVRVRATAGAQEQARSIPVNSRTLFLDNLVASHFQVLLDRYLAEPEASRGGEWTFVVPQALTAVRGTITATGEATGALDGRPITGRRYALEAGGNVVEITATADGALLRVTVPVQRVELIREGYVDGAASASPPEPLPCEERDVRVRRAPIRCPGRCACRGPPSPLPSSSSPMGPVPTTGTRRSGRTSPSATSPAAWRPPASPACATTSGPSRCAGASMPPR
jgi:hypothetical protein